MTTFSSSSPSQSSSSPDHTESQGEGLTVFVGHFVPSTTTSTSTSSPTKDSTKIARYMLVAAAVVILLAGVMTARIILAPTFMAMFFAVLLYPALKWLTDKKLPVILAIAVLSMMTLGVCLGVSWVVYNSAVRFADRIPGYRNKINRTLDEIDDLLTRYGILHNESKLDNPPSETLQDTTILPTEGSKDSITSGIPSGGGRAVELAASTTVSSVYPPANRVSVPRRTPPPDEDSDNGEQPEMAKTTDGDTTTNSQIAVSDPAKMASNDGTGDGDDFRNRNESGFDAIFSHKVAVPWEQAKPLLQPKRDGRGFEISSDTLMVYARYFISGFTRLITLSFVIMLLVIFMLIEAAAFPKKVAAAFSSRDVDNHIREQNLEKIAVDIRNYMLLKGAVSLIVGVICTLFLITMQIEYALFWGLTAFFLNFVPNIGSIVAAVPPVILALVDHDPVTCLIVAGGYILINCFMGYIVEPPLLGQGLGISPLVVLLSLLFWGYLLGPIGMFLAAPLSVVVKIILHAFDETKWVAVLMADKVDKGAAGNVAQ